MYIYNIYIYVCVLTKGVLCLCGCLMKSVFVFRQFVLRCSVQILGSPAGKTSSLTMEVLYQGIPLFSAGKLWQCADSLRDSIASSGREGCLFHPRLGLANVVRSQVESVMSRMAEA